MARGYSSEIKYKTNSVPLKWEYGRKMQSDYTYWSYEDLLVRDDYGNLYDPRREEPDLDLGPGVLGSKGSRGF